MLIDVVVLFQGIETAGRGCGDEPATASVVCDVDAATLAAADGEPQFHFGGEEIDIGDTTATLFGFPNGGMATIGGATGCFGDVVFSLAAFCHGAFIGFGFVVGGGVATTTAGAFTGCGDGN